VASVAAMKRPWPSQQRRPISSSCSVKCRTRQSQYPEAAESFREALKSGRTLPRAHFGLAWR
jgi:hypothetical protein